IVMVLLCFGVAYVIGTNIQSELAPMEDRSQFRLRLTAPEGTAYDYMDSYVQNLVQFVMDSVPENTTVISVTAPGFTGAGARNNGFIRVTLSDPNTSDRSQQEIVDAVSAQLGRFPQGRAIPQQVETSVVSRRGGLPVQFVLQNNDFERIKT